MPPIGLGVWHMAEGRDTEQAVTQALASGYRLIDTARFYGNEASVGRAVARYIGTGAAVREDIFITTKLWPTDFGHPEKAFHRSLEALGLAYIDLYLIHWPIPLMPRGIWRALERICEQKLARSIGVSNYDENDIGRLLSYANSAPAVNQIKFSVFDHNLELLEFCTSRNIAVEAYSPLERGRINHPTVEKIAEIHKKSPAQILIRWCLEHGTVPLPKSSRPERIRENRDVFDFELTKNEMVQLDALGN